MNHLAEDQLAHYLAGAEDALVRTHLDDCPECRREADHLVALVGAAKMPVATTMAAQPPAFWARQRAAIAQRLPVDRVRRPVWAAAAAVAVLLLASPLLVQVERRKPTPQTTTTKTISDDKLFAEINATLQQQVPPALEPAAMLLNQDQQIESSTNPNSAVARR